MVVKLQWKQNKSIEGPFAVDVPDVFTQASVMEKDTKRLRKAVGGDWDLFLLCAYAKSDDRCEKLAFQ